MPVAAAPNTTVSDKLKLAMRQMPSPVAIVSAIDPKTSAPCGLAVTAYTPVSMDPPSMQICINRNASAYGAILLSKYFSINVLGIGGVEIIQSFSDPEKKACRFSEGDWEVKNGIC